MSAEFKTKVPPDVRRLICEMVEASIARIIVDPTGKEQLEMREPSGKVKLFEIEEKGLRRIK